MIPRELFTKLGGLDEAFVPAYYEETDLCMRIRAAGYRILYEPSIEISHFEFGSSSFSDAAPALQRNFQIFKKRHGNRLLPGGDCGQRDRDHQNRLPEIQTRPRMAQGVSGYAGGDHQNRDLRGPGQ